jgi:hypothetical protein
MSMHFEEHESPIIREAMRRNGSCCEGNAAEGLDGVGVQLERLLRLSPFERMTKMMVISVHTCVIFIIFNSIKKMQR